MLRTIPVLVMLFVLVVGNVFAFDPLNDKPTGGVSKVDTAVQKIWGTVLTILQVCAVAAVVYAGVKYMFAGADQKADIKSGMLGLVVGAIMVFAASTIIQFIINAGNEVIK